MRGKLVFVLGNPELADEAARRLGVMARCAPELCHSVGVQDAFLSLLGAHLRCEAGKGAVLKLAQPLLLPVALRRMVERVALGLGCLGLDGRPGAEPPASWLAGSCLQPIKATSESLSLLLSYQEEVLTNPGGGLGAWPSLHAPRVSLLVGERPSGRWRGGRPNWPFISSNNNGCSSWLAEHLEAGGVPESELYWVNAYAADGTPNDATPLLGTMFDQVIALGKRAHLWLELNNIGHRQVHHPMYWKRYHYNDAYILSKILTDPL